MIKKFRSLMDDDEEMVIDIDSLINDKERIIFSKWLSIFDTITPFNIPQALDTIIEEHSLTKRDSVILLSYIKFFEQRIFEMGKQNKERKKNHKKYDGAMYG
jgi:hypothetical protein